jgi:beta-glucosidase
MATLGITGIPFSDEPHEIEAARKYTFDLTEPDFHKLSLWHDPMFKGRLPENYEQIFGKDSILFTPEELKIIASPVDYFGFNHYQSPIVKASPTGQAERTNITEKGGYPRTAFEWPLTPDSLYWAARFYYEEYKMPVMVMENGMANVDWVSLDGAVHDPQRIDFIKRYLLALERAIKEGVDVRGYFLWTLMDNFEWAEGFTKRFGLVHVDFNTQKRIMKDSGLFYRQVIRTNGACIHL